MACVCFDVNISDIWFCNLLNGAGDDSDEEEEDEAEASDDDSSASGLMDPEDEAEYGLDAGDRPIERDAAFKYDVLVKWWKFYPPRLVPDLVCVAHMLCPHPKVMEVVKTTPDPEDRNAVERMIDKLLSS